MNPNQSGNNLNQDFLAGQGLSQGLNQTNIQNPTELKSQTQNTTEEKLAKHFELKAKYQEKYTVRQDGKVVFVESKEKYGGNGSPVEGYVFSVPEQTNNTNQNSNHTRYPTQEPTKPEAEKPEQGRVETQVKNQIQTQPKSQLQVKKPNQIQAINTTNQSKIQTLEPPKQAIQPYFLQGNHCLFQGDCVEIMKQLPDNYVDMIFADPPYFLSEPSEEREVTNFPVKDLKDKNGNYDNYKGEWDVSRGFVHNVNFQYFWIKEAKRILKPNGTIWITGTHHSIYQCGFCLQNLNFKILNEISWYKPKSKYNPKKYFNFSHETIIWARKSKNHQDIHYFNEPLMSKWRGDPLKDSNPENSQSMRTVWQIDPPTKKECLHGRHPTQKPIQLLQRIILASTKPDAIILDPFNGSGTTGVAMETINQGLRKSPHWDGKIQRKYIGIDREVEYLELSKRRFGGVSGEN